MKTKKAPKGKQDLGGFRTVILTNGTEYVAQYNLAFAIVRLGTKSEAAPMFLKDAPDVIRELGRYGVHKFWAEVVEG